MEVKVILLCHYLFRAQLLKIYEYECGFDNDNDNEFCCQLHVRQRIIQLQLEVLQPWFQIFQQFRLLVVNASASLITASASARTSAT